MNRSRLILVQALVLAVVATVALQGCSKRSGSGATVQGKVTYKGEPVTGGAIAFHPSDGGTPYQGSLKADGTFVFADVPLGDVKVTVDTEGIKSISGNPYPTDKMPGGKKPPKDVAKSSGPEGLNSGMTYVKIPAKYAKAGTTTLTATIEKGKKTYDFELTD